MHDPLTVQGEPSLMSALFLIFPWALALIPIAALVKLCVSARGRQRMLLRIVMALLTIVTVFSAYYCAAFLVIAYLIPPDFGMPTYEEEMELAIMVCLLAFSVVPLFLSFRASAFLNRHVLSQRPAQ